jgi:DNA-binding PadR family transcriptional regulator
MARWDILRQDRAREAELASPRPKRQDDSGQGSVSVGRGPGDASSSSAADKPRSQENPLRDRALRHRTHHRDQDRTYSLRHREIVAMTDIGTFRTVDVRDLSRFAYGGNEAAMNYDLHELRAQGLVEEKTVPQAHKQPRNVVALTERGHRILRKASGLRKDQAIYHGYVKAREINHDADLYKVYQQAAEEIRQRGGKPVRVRLDFELKAAIQRERNALKDRAEGERRERLEAFAREHGLTISEAVIHVPDVQVEYETRDGELERTNLELVSENYRTEGIRSKAESGFTIYARGDDTTRVRRALHDTHTVERILSI